MKYLLLITALLTIIGCLGTDPETFDMSTTSSNDSSSNSSEQSSVESSDTESSSLLSSEADESSDMSSIESSSSASIIGSSTPELDIDDAIDVKSINGVTILNVPQAAPDAREIDAVFDAQIDGFTDFSFDLLRQINIEEMNNVMFSPHSIISAMSMVYPGAANSTKEEFEQLFNYQETENDNNRLMYTLNQELIPDDYSSPYTEFREDGDAEEIPFTFNMVNSTWGDQTFPFNPDYLADISSYYDAGMNVVDFINNYEEIRVTINDWVSDETNDKIKDLIPEGAISDATRMVLVNAIYMKANWQDDFSESATTDTEFTLLDNSKVNVSTMYKKDNMQGIKTEGYAAVRLPYVGNEYSMLLVVPNDFNTTVTNLNATLFAEISADLPRNEIKLSLPKFKIEASYTLKDIFMKMGMTESFSDAADFSGFHAESMRDLFISDIVHKTFIAIDEKGTEAAAATAVMMAGGSLPPESIEISFDKPFLYFIQHNETGHILFMGQVLNPAE